MVDRTRQLPQELATVQAEVTLDFNQLRSILTDILNRLDDLEKRIETLENA